MDPANNHRRTHRRQSREVVISGAFYGTNFGDHLFAMLMAQAVGPDAVLKDACEDVVRTAECRSVNPLAVVNSRGLILGPGGYFGEAPGEPLLKKLVRLRYHYVPALLARLCGTPYCIAGVGVGPIQSALTRWLLRAVVEGAQLVSVRDNESAAHLREYAVKVREPLVVAPDAALQWHRLKVGGRNHRRDLGSAGRQEGRRVLLHVEPTDSRSLASYFDTAIREAMREPDVELVLAADRCGARAEEVPAAAAAIDEFPGRVSWFEYRDPLELIAMISTVDAVVTHKLHVGIIGCSLGKAVVSFSVHPKIARFYEQIGQRERCRELRQMGESDIVQHYRRYSTLPVRIDPAVLDESGQHYGLIARFMIGLAQ